MIVLSEIFNPGCGSDGHLLRIYTAIAYKILEIYEMTLKII